MNLKQQIDRARNLGMRMQAKGFGYEDNPYVDVIPVVLMTSWAGGMADAEKVARMVTKAVKPSIRLVMGAGQAGEIKSALIAS